MLDANQRRTRRARPISAIRSIIFSVSLYCALILRRRIAGMRKKVIARLRFCYAGSHAYSRFRTPSSLAAAVSHNRFDYDHRCCVGDDGLLLTRAGASAASLD
jgi:hypothetical protein